MAIPWRFIIVTAMTVAQIAPAASAQVLPQNAEPLDAARVLSSIERGVAYLKREQSPRGTWREEASYPSGITALVTLALLNAGVPPDDPVMRRALDHLRGVELTRTYSVALQTMVFCAAEPRKDLVLIQRNVRWLEQNQEQDGAWSYPGAATDNSNSQFAVLALYEAQLVGARVNRRTWQRIVDYWRDTQNPDGSWGYHTGNAGSGSMTSAGIAALTVATAALEEGDAKVEGEQVLCCQPHSDDDRLERAVEWLARRFSVQRNPISPGSGSFNAIYYYLYGLERVGRLTARRFIGEHDWYREGVEFLVLAQDPLEHFWKGTWHMEGGDPPHVSTAFALLFLSKGRRPIVMGKLQYADEGQWNPHRRDAAHLTAFAESAWHLPLTWQTFDPERASVEDLLQAPVLYMSGSQGFQLGGEAQKIRDYIDRGGFVFAEAACSDAAAFETSFRSWVEQIFPEQEYRLRQLPPSHPIWRMEQVVRPESPYAGRLWAVEYGCRTCVVFSEADLSCYWELASPSRVEKYADSVEQHIADALAIGVNVLTYATNREPKGKEQHFVLPLEDAELEALGGRGVFEIAKLQHGGGCNDAPGALVNLLQTARQGELQLTVRAGERLIVASSEELPRYQLAFMHGRHSFRLTPAERQNLREYLENGGTLLADSICASRPFATALRSELALIFPDRPIEPIAGDDPLWTSAYGGYDVRRVTLRDPQAVDDGRPISARLQQTPPRLEGIRIDGRWAVVFSPYDISCALENHESVECRGYIREDAARIALNVLMYVLNQ